ncbi:unnamed protein product [Brassicogethes aeneus]|uniref:Uncharacterized protein n=1 Tax=Brassicogethes aeneus TaxID=1431903 RepID=A0A9P0B2Y2_BRAAE|nr:unnamed protein product [Brassicogethes aeneus]
MKNYTVILACIIVLSIASAKKQTKEERSKFKEVHEQCQNDERTCVDEMLIRNWFGGIFIEDDKLKNHMLCMAKGLNFINENGKLNEHFIKSKWIEHYDGKEVKNLQECLKEKSTYVETSWDFFKCQHNAINSVQQ